MPAPLLDFEQNLMEPLTTVFAEFQEKYNTQDFDADPNLKTLPSCYEIIHQTVSTNMLMADIYAPKSIFKDYEQSEVNQK